jgi:hypothetical protein
MGKRKKVEKVVRDGKVAVLVSPGFGAGWSTWNSSYPELLFDPVVVDLVEKDTGNKKRARYERQGLSEKTIKKIEAHIAEKYPEQYVYCGGAEDLTIVWMDEGTKFYVDEYDGSESIRTTADLSFTA